MLLGLFVVESSLHDSAASDINSNTVVMVPSGSLDVDGTVTMLGIFVLLLLAFIIVTSIVFAFRYSCFTSPQLYHV